MKEKILGISMTALLAVCCYFYLCLSCTAKQENVEQEAYAQMAQELVQQNIK